MPGGVHSLQPSLPWLGQPHNFVERGTHSAQPPFQQHGGERHGGTQLARLYQEAGLESQCACQPQPWLGPAHLTSTAGLSATSQSGSHPAPPHLRQPANSLPETPRCSLAVMLFNLCLSQRQARGGGLPPHHHLQACTAVHQWWRMESLRPTNLEPPGAQQLNPQKGRLDGLDTI
jgi:hypothetical protein